MREWSKDPAIVVHGNPVDGFRHIGPFEDGGKASEWLATNKIFDSWWIVELADPEDW